MFGLYDLHDEGLSGPVEYNADVFDAATIGRLLELFYRLIDAVTADPELRLSQLPAFDTVASLQVLADLDDLGSGAEPAAEVVARAARLAPALRRLGAGPGVKVGLLLGPSPERAALALAVRGLGGVPVPLDPAEPAVRLDVLLTDAALAVLVHGDTLPEGLAIGAVRVPLARLRLEEEEVPA
jgi:non-ribosomal peptide synthetase component F